MNADHSFEKINYYLRPNKQVERKILIDILLHFRKYIDLNLFSYVGMGSIYYYDFILIHRMLGIKKMISFDFADSVKRFYFNKPYDFISFYPEMSTKYLSRHPWQETNTICWLDYDGAFYQTIDSIINDIKIIAQNANNHDLVFITVACFPLKGESKKLFLTNYARYISPEYQSIEWTKEKDFPYLIQNILNNIFVSENLSNGNKYTKICSFYYRDGAPMYTLGGFFTSDTTLLNEVENMHEYVSFDPKNIHSILIPQITYKEKHYLDNNISRIGQLIDEFTELVKLDEIDVNKHEDLIEKYLNESLDFELRTTQLKNYIQHYRFMPQYFEGLI